MTLAPGMPDLIEQAGPDQSLFVIWSGTLAVTARGRRSETEFLGDGNAGRNGRAERATPAIERDRATAVDEPRVLKLSHAAFREIQKHIRSLLLQLMHVVTRRCRHAAAFRDSCEPAVRRSWTKCVEGLEAGSSWNR